MKSDLLYMLPPDTPTGGEPFVPFQTPVTAPAVEESAPATEPVPEQGTEGTPPPAPEPPKEHEPVDADDFDQEAVKELERLSAKVRGVGQTPAEAAASTPAPAQPAPPAGQPTEVDYLAGIEGVDKLDFTREQLAFVNKFGNRLASEVRTQLIQLMGNAIPKYVQQVNNSQRLYTDFYTQHPELRDVANYVGVIYQEVEEENIRAVSEGKAEAKSTQQMLEETAIRAKKVFKKGKPTDGGSSENPSRGPNSGTGSRPPQDKTPKPPESPVLAHLKQLGRYPR